MSDNSISIEIEMSEDVVQNIQHMADDIGVTFDALVEQVMSEHLESEGYSG